MKSTDKLATTKTITKFVVGRCVGTIVATVIKDNMPMDTRTEKVQVFIGAHVLGMMVSEVTGVYTDHKIDQIAAGWREFRQGFIAGNTQK